MDHTLKTMTKRSRRVLLLLFAGVAVLSLCCLFVGSSNMSLSDCLRALIFKGTEANQRIVWNIRIPRVLASVIAGAGLAVAGLIMQSTLNNPMASPSTLGVSNAAVFGANLSIIAFSGGALANEKNLFTFLADSAPFATGIMAFGFALLSVLIILGLCSLRSFSPGTVVLAGIAVGSLWTAATTVLQFYATDVGISAAVIWNFGDLGRATYKADLIMLCVVAAGIVFYVLCAWKLNALLSGDNAASAMGVNVPLLRFLCMTFSSMMTAVCVSFLGIIGFVGIICPHVAKKLLGQDHRISVVASALCGSLLLLFADTLSRCLGGGSALPVGAITSIAGAPFFIAIIFAKKEEK